MLSACPPGKLTARPTLELNLTSILTLLKYRSSLLAGSYCSGLKRSCAKRWLRRLPVEISSAGAEGLKGPSRVTEPWLSVSTNHSCRFPGDLEIFGCAAGHNCEVTGKSVQCESRIRKLGWESGGIPSMAPTTGTTTPPAATDCARAVMLADWQGGPSVEIV